MTGGLAPNRGQTLLRCLTPFALAGFLVGCAAETSDWRPLAAPVPAVDFTLPQVGGGTVRLGELRGRVVLVEFWATWCEPCRYSSPSLDVTYRRFRDQGVMALLVNQGESEDVVRRWAGKRFVAPILLDEDSAVGAAYEVDGIPTLLVIDRAGNVRYRESGYAGGLERNLRVILTGLLAEPPAAGVPGRSRRG